MNDKHFAQKKQLAAREKPGCTKKIKVRDQSFVRENDFLD
jgi:hypothetical protein